MPISFSNSPLLALAPLGAGDLIDRAVRFYRNNFWTFVWIAAPPIILGTIISVIWTILARQLFSGNSANAQETQVFSSIFTGFGNLVIWLVESVATLIVMGGASRNFVRHLIFGQPITFRETYINVRARLSGLIVASTVIAFLLIILSFVILWLGLLILSFAIVLTISLFSFSGFLSSLVSFVLSLAILFGTGWLFFLAASRFAYVPQVMLVEGSGVFQAIGRSASLASGNVKRLAALFVFTTLATYSALSLLYIPLGWYAYLNGVEVFSFGDQMLPAWYTIANQAISQASLILLMPIWMIGLCLLYVDERVRHEGYDIELAAARRLGEIPPLPARFMNPLQPALATQDAAALPQNQTPPKRKSSITTLGLN